MLKAIIDPLKLWAEGVISALGYPAFFLLMMLDAANIPIPSEAVMPFGGIMVGEGKLGSFHLVALSGSLGTVVGSCISYWVAAKLGKDFLLKYGKFVFLRPKEIEHAEAWFNKYGLNVTLWGRFIPIVRTFISLPAGLFRADFKRFVVYAIIGALPWCYAWTWIGFVMGKNWKTVEENMKYVDIVVILALLYLIVKFLRYRFAEKGVVTEAGPTEGV